MGQIYAGIRIVLETPLHGPTEETPDVAMFCYSVVFYGHRIRISRRVRRFWQDTHWAWQNLS